MATTGKQVAMIFDQAVDSYEKQTQLLKLVNHYEPDGKDMQNSGDQVWRQVKQHAPIIDGWDTTGLETDIIQETYPASLGTPKNDRFNQRADSLRDMQFWMNRAKVSGERQASELNKRIANLIVNTGSMYFEVTASGASGYDTIAQAQALLNERQLPSDDQRFICLNDRDNLLFGSDLAGRQTLQGRPAETWATGQIGQNVAGFDVYTGSFLPTIAGGALVSTTANGAVSEKPEAGTVNTTTNTVTNIDYRTSTVTVLASAGYAVGDHVKFANAGTDVQSVGLADKTASGQAMTFVITAVPNGTSITLYPKPIAPDDAALSTLEKAYSNIDTQILTGATVVKLNTFVTTPKKANIFWCKDAIEVTGGNAPLQLLSEYAGMKIISHVMENGQTMYMAYDGDIDTLQFSCRLFTWYGETMANPSACGSFVTV